MQQFVIVHQVRGCVHQYLYSVTSSLHLLPLQKTQQLLYCNSHDHKTTTTTTTTTNTTTTTTTTTTTIITFSFVKLL